MKNAQTQLTLISIPVRFGFVSAFFMLSTLSVHASESKAKLLDVAQLDQISAGAASATVHAQAGALGLNTLAGTGAKTRAYVSNCHYVSVNIASGTGFAIANGTVSGATVEITANVTGKITSSHTTSHTAQSVKSGSSYASGYTMQVSYTRIR